MRKFLKSNLTLLCLLFISVSAFSQHSFYLLPEIGTSTIYTNFKPENADFKTIPALTFNAGFGYSYQFKSDFLLGTNIFISQINDVRKTIQEYDTQKSVAKVKKSNNYFFSEIYFGYKFNKIKISAGNMMGYRYFSVYSAKGENIRGEQKINWQNSFEPSVSYFDSGIKLTTSYLIKNNIDLGISLYSSYINLNNLDAHFPEFDYPYKNYNQQLTFFVKYNIINLKK